MSLKIEHVNDSFALLRSQADQSFDHVITDPPYDEHVHGNMCSGTAVKKWRSAGGGGSIPKVEAGFDPLESYAFTNDLIRVARRWAISWCSVEAFGLIKQAVGPSYVRSGLWLKPNSMGQLTKDRPAVCYEGIAIMHRPTKRIWNGKGSYGAWVCNGTRGETDRHKFQKPLKLCLKLVALFTTRGETVFDPFSGSGRIGEACLLLGRNFVGWERDQEWVDKSMARLSAIDFGSWTDEDALKLCNLKEKKNVKDSLQQGETSRRGEGSRRLAIGPADYPSLWDYVPTQP